MDVRTRALVTISVISSRYEWREELRRELAQAHVGDQVLREELYECFLQLQLFAGFPAALEAMRSLQHAWPLANELTEHELRQLLRAPEQDLAAGEALYERIYSSNAGVVRREMIKLSPDLGVRAVADGYGKTLSRPGLDVETRELAIVGVLTQLGWERQAFSHMLGARNVGVEQGDILEAITIGARGEVAKVERMTALLERL